MRSMSLYALAAVLIAALIWAISFSARETADFTFCNGTEIKSVDPAISTGQPEGRVIMALFEGLAGMDPKTLQPVPGVAENIRFLPDEKRWECISDDGLIYTLKLRSDARWSDGSPVVADDFVYSFQRFLNPQTLVQYATLLTAYVVEAERYLNPSLLQAGDPVEVELEDPANDKIGVRGPLAFGKLLEIAPKPTPTNNDDHGHDDPPAPAGPPPVYTVEIDGEVRRYQSGAPAGGEILNCRQVLLDFRQVGIKALDERTLEIRLMHRTPFFINLLAFYPLFPVNRKCIETYGTPRWTHPENIVTNGPFVLQDRRLRDRIRLAKNPHYWDAENVALESVDILAVESDVTMLNMYMAGQVDWIPNVPAPIVPELLKRRDAALAAGERPDFDPQPELTVNFYRLNVTRPPLDNVRVRQALALAIDRRELVEVVTRAGEAAAYSLTPPGIVGYDPPQMAGAGEDYAARVRRAQQLLVEAGFPGGRDATGRPLRVEIQYNTNETHQAIAELIQRRWRLGLGVDAFLRQQEWNSYLTSQQNLDYTISRAGWIGDYVDPNTFLELFVSDNPNNQTGWKNSDFDRLMQGANAEADPERRLAMLREAEELLLEELPIVPLYFRVDKNMVRPYVHGFYKNLQDVHPLKYIRVDHEARREFWQREGAR